MKSKIMVFIFVSLFAVFAIYFSYRQGELNGTKKSNETSSICAFLASFDTLQKMRSGDVSGAIKRLEPYCYTSAGNLFEIQGEKTKLILSHFNSDIAAYLNAYADPLQDQYYSEKQLIFLLKTNDIVPEGRGH